jgi:hypothetical protein
MNKHFLPIFICCIWLSGLSLESYAQYEPQSVDEQEIITTFANYKSGFEQFNANYILKNISASSVRFFDTVLYLAQQADSASLASLPVSQMVMVLEIRNKVYAKLAKVSSTNELIDVMLNHGIIREDMEWQIADIEIKDTIAYCSALLPSSPKPKDIIFVKDSDFWKIDLYSQYNESDRSFNNLLNNEELMKQYNLSRASLYQQIYQKLGIPAGSSVIWQPVK